MSAPRRCVGELWARGEVGVEMKRLRYWDAVADRLGGGAEGAKRLRVALIKTTT